MKDYILFMLKMCIDGVIIYWIYRKKLFFEIRDC